MLRLNKIVFLTVFLILTLFAFPAAYVYAQGYSRDTAETIAVGSEKRCVYMSSGEHWYKFYATRGTYTVSINPAPNLDADLYVYDKDGILVGSSPNSAGAVDVVVFNIHTEAFSGYYYIKVKYYSGSGYYNILVSTSTSATASEPSCTTTTTTTPRTTTTTTTTTNTPPPSSGDGGSCPCAGVPWPCSCVDILGDFDPCRLLARMYCGFRALYEAIVGFVNAVREFFTGIYNSIVGFFSWIAQGIQNLVNSVVNFFTSLGEGMVNFFIGIGNFLASIPSAIVSFFQSLWNGIVNAFSGFAEAVGPAGGWLNRNWPYVLGFALIIAGFVFGGWLSIVGIVVVVGYMLTVGDLSWQMVLFAIGATIIVLALRD